MPRPVQCALPWAPRGGWGLQLGGKTEQRLNLLFHLRQPLRCGSSVWGASQVQLHHTHTHTHTQTLLLGHAGASRNDPTGHLREVAWGSTPSTTLIPVPPHHQAVTRTPALTVLLKTPRESSSSAHVTARKPGHRGVKECPRGIELGFGPRQSGPRVCAGNHSSLLPP